MDGRSPTIQFYDLEHVPFTLGPLCSYLQTEGKKLFLHQGLRKHAWHCVGNTSMPGTERSLANAHFLPFRLLNC